MKRKKVIVILVAIIGVITIGRFVFENKNKLAISEKVYSQNTAVEVFNVKNSHIQKYKKFSGVLSAGEKEVVSPKAISNITSIKVKEGDYVKRGQLLMTLDSSQLDKQISELDKVNKGMQAGIVQNEKKLEELKLKNTEVSKLIEKLNGEIGLLEEENIKVDEELKSLEKKLEAQEVTNEEYELKKYELSILKSDNINKINKNKLELKTLEMTKQTLEKSIKELEKVFNNSSQNNQIGGMLEGLKDKKGEYTIVSSISGTVKEMNLKVGQMPLSFTKAGILIENIATIDFEFPIMKEDLEKFKIGMQVDIYIDVEGKEKKIKGNIESISKQEDEMLKQYKVVATMENLNNEIKVGSFAKVMLETDIKHNVITIPKDCLIREEGKTFVYISENNIAKKIQVITGTENHNEIEIKKGLSVGNKIIVTGKEFIKSGEEVNIVNEVQLDENN